MARRTLVTRVGFVTWPELMATSEDAIPLVLARCQGVPKNDAPAVWESAEELLMQAQRAYWGSVGLDEAVASFHVPGWALDRVGELADDLLALVMARHELGNANSLHAAIVAWRAGERIRGRA